MRILNVGLGGVTREFRNWPERIHTAALARRGHHVVAYGYLDPSSPLLSTREEHIDGVLVRRLPRRHWPTPELWRALDRDGPFDVVHFEHPRNVLAYGVARWCKAHGVPTVYTWLGPFHDRYLIDDREQPYDERPKYERLIFTKRELLRRVLLDRRKTKDALVLRPSSFVKRVLDHYRNYWLHWPLAQATALLPCSEHEAMILREMGLQQPSTMVPLWIDTQQPSSDTVFDLDAYPAPRILYVGQLTRRKCYDLMVEAMPDVVARFPTASFLFVSHNPEQRAHLMQLAEACGVANHVYFLGRLSDDELDALRRAVDVFAYPSRYEGFGLPPLEAMAASCPVVTTDIPVLNEVVRHGENGWLVRYNDAAALGAGICTLLAEPELRERLISGGHATLRKRFDEERLVGQVLDIFEHVRTNG